MSKNLLEAFWTDLHILLKVQKYGIHHLKLVTFPLFTKVLYVPGGAGFLPSTVYAFGKFRGGKRWVISKCFEVFGSGLKSIFCRWFKGKSQKESFWVGLEALLLGDFYSPPKKRCDPFNMLWYTHGQKINFFQESSFLPPEQPSLLMFPVLVDFPQMLEAWMVASPNIDTW